MLHLRSQRGELADAARAERDRNTEARHQAEAEIARLLGELTAAVGSHGAHPAAPPGVEANDPTSKGAMH